MSVQTEINRITENVAESYDAAEALGASLPAQQNSDNLPETIRAIPTAKIVQGKGDSTTDVMSQAAVSAELNGLSEEIAGKTTIHTLTGADLHNQSFSTESNGLAVGDIVVVTEWYESTKGITYNEGDMWEVTAVNTIQLVVHLKGQDGSDGEDGKTPVKGTDYFTSADIQEIVNAVYNKVADGNGVAY